MQIIPFDTLPPSPTIADVMHLIMRQRSLTTPDAINTFFSPPHPSTLSLLDFGFSEAYRDNAMRIIWSLHDQKRPIIVYSDYDADGVTGGAVLWETLYTLGFPVIPYIGNRIEEGYGFSQKGLDHVKKTYDPALIISVDHGIAAREMVRYAATDLHIPIIITDHHHRQEEKVPDDAVSIFHIPALAGSGVAYYVAKEIAHFDNDKHMTPALSDAFMHDYVGLAAIGTIADLVPLIGPSRAVAKHGLDALTTTKRPGIEALKMVSDHLGKTITTYEVGFMMAPRINASGRLADALTALRLLCTKDKAKATTIAQKLQSLNTERQDMVKHAVIEAIEIVEKKKNTNDTIPKILIVYQDTIKTESDTTKDESVNEYWHEGIIGLIASKLVEKYHRPTLVLTRNESGHKASCRSIPGFHLTDFLKMHAEYLLHFGGHAAAAGFSIAADRLQGFESAALQNAEILITDDMLKPAIEVLCELPLSLASTSLVHELGTLAPFGMGNPKPIFASHGTVARLTFIGSEGQHARFTFCQGDTSLECIAFNKAELLKNIKEPSTIIYSLEINHWNGREKLQAKLLSIF